MCGDVLARNAAAMAALAGIGFCGTGVWPKKRRGRRKEPGPPAVSVISLRVTVSWRTGIPERPNSVNRPQHGSRSVGSLGCCSTHLHA
jgi:hypothetical protein